MIDCGSICEALLGDCILHGVIRNDKMEKRTFQWRIEVAGAIVTAPLKGSLTQLRNLRNTVHITKIATTSAITGLGNGLLHDGTRDYQFDESMEGSASIGKRGTVNIIDGRATTKPDRATAQLRLLVGRYACVVELYRNILMEDSA
ncbi:hypothetical protein NKJ50_14800 [Mesorhizobium sp. M0115]|uniref:hypothetical protein n=1 Tax=unclassified Mesorhizobium TaxID=325217 RepID=UPI00333A9591